MPLLVSQRAGAQGSSTSAVVHLTSSPALGDFLLGGVHCAGAPSAGSGYSALRTATNGLVVDQVATSGESSAQTISTFPSGSYEAYLYDLIGAASTPIFGTAEAVGDGGTISLGVDGSAPSGSLAFIFVLGTGDISPAPTVATPSGYLADDFQTLGSSVLAVYRSNGYVSGDVTTTVSYANFASAPTAVLVVVQPQGASLSANASASVFNSHGSLSAGASASIKRYRNGETITAPLVVQETISAPCAVEEIMTSSGGVSSETPSRVYPVPPTPPPPALILPPWNDDTIPAGALVGKTSSTAFDSSEQAAIASNWPSIVFIIHSGSTGYWEDQVSALYTPYKTRNPSGLMGFYVGFHQQRTQLYRYWQQPELQTWYAEYGGQYVKGKDVENAAFRDAWSTDVAWLLANYPFDGVFVDSLGPGFDPNKYAMIAELRKKIPAGKFIWGNCAPTLTPGQTYFDGNALHGCFNETSVGAPNGNGTSPIYLKQTLQQWIAYAKTGWPGIMKVWPGFWFNDEKGPTWPTTYGARVVAARATNAISFALGYFLCGMYPYSYVQYSWGYNYDGGNLVLEYDANGNIIGDPSGTVDTSWYADFFNALGAPTGDAVFGGTGLGAGYFVTRSFAHATVSVNLVAQTATVTFD
jgi:hypothetical protein